MSRLKCRRRCACTRGGKTAPINSSTVCACASGIPGRGILALRQRAHGVGARVRDHNSGVASCRTRGHELSA